MCVAVCLECFRMFEVRFVIFIGIGMPNRSTGIQMAYDGVGIGGIPIRSLTYDRR